jgi:hypothetical protein
MEPIVQSLKQIHSPLYDRRLMILILKKSNGRRSFSETSRWSKIAHQTRNWGHGPGSKTNKETNEEVSPKEI